MPTPVPEVRRLRMLHRCVEDAGKRRELELRLRAALTGARMDVGRGDGDRVCVSAAAERRGELLALCQPLLQRYAIASGMRGEDVQIVAQRASLRIVDALAHGQYDPRRGGLCTWLYGMVHHA